MRTIAAILFVATLAGCVDSDPSDPPAATTTAPFVPDNVYGGGNASQQSLQAIPRYFATGFNGPEPNMGVTSSGALFVSAYSTIIRSRDGGESWQPVQTHDPLMNSDPMMWVDPWTDHVYNAPMFPPLACALIYVSEDDGDSWTPVPTPNCGRTVYDHQKLASGPPGPDAPPAAGSTHDSVLYMCYNGVATTNCALSYDNGKTWPHDAPTNANVVPPVGPTAGTLSGCGSGQNGHPTVSDNGIVAFGKTWGCAEPWLVYSTDSGLTWTTVPGPQGKGGGSLDPEIAFDSQGTLYYHYQGSDHRAYVASTPDLGQTWNGPYDVTPPNVTSTAFNALAAGDDGRIGITFLGTTDGHEGNPSNAPSETRWHVWMVVSDNAASEAPTFTAYRVTPDDDPVQIGCVWLGGGSNPCRNMLDFIDGAIHPDGTFYTAYTEGCHEGCAFGANATDGDSRARIAAVARLDGFSLYAPGPVGVAVETIGRP